MSIAPKCTCRMSPSSFCLSGIKECKQFKPEEIMENKYPIGEPLTREALEIELWSMLPDDCRKALEPLKKSYIESLMADIDSYCTNKQYTPQGPVWVKAAEGLPGWGKPVTWRHQSGKELPGKQTISDMTDRGPISLHGFEWLDESGQPILEWSRNK